jgi:peptide/nickel transport system ATP-binding protein/oligopeptide transport system ATP-binding protein
MNPLLQVSELAKEYRKGNQSFHAVSQVAFSIARGETFGLIGESGSGKSTVAKMITGLEPPTDGTVLYEGAALWTAHKFNRLKPGEMQIVFQDPQSSLDPRMRVQSIITEPLQALPPAERKAKGATQRLHALITRVGLKVEHLNRFPHEFSGGQRQRIAIARALITDPAFVVLDEPTSALDVSVQAHVLNLLQELKRERNLTYLFISHNMSVIRYMCDRMAVMKKGRIVESGTL